MVKKNRHYLNADEKFVSKTIVYPDIEKDYNDLVPIYYDPEFTEPVNENEIFDLALSGVAIYTRNDERGANTYGFPSEVNIANNGAIILLCGQLMCVSPSTLEKIKAAAE